MEDEGDTPEKLGNHLLGSKSNHLKRQGVELESEKLKFPKRDVSNNSPQKY